MKVYIVINHDVWGNSIEGVFLKKHDAEIQKQSFGHALPQHEIEEHEVIE